MQQRALVMALFAAGTIFPAAGRAEDCSQMFIYSVNQVCRTLSGGFTQCQPVGMVGPAPQCSSPGVPPIMAVPLAPPVTQPPLSPFVYQPPFPAMAVPQAPAPVAAPVVPATPVIPAPVAAATPAPVAPVAKPAVEAPKPAPVVQAPPAPASPAVSPVVAPAPVLAKPATEAPAVEAAKPAATTTPAVASTPVPVAVPAAPVVKVEAPAAAPAKPADKPAAVADKPASPVAETPKVADKPASVDKPAPAQAEARPAKPTYPAPLVLQDGIAHFEFDRADLSEKARAELDAWLAQPLPPGKSLRVTGHADRLGPAPYNLKLSGRRALTVKKYLEGKGVAGKNIHVVAKGEADPVKECPGRASKATIACLAPNRRVEIDPE